MVMPFSSSFYSVKVDFFFKGVGVDFLRGVSGGVAKKPLRERWEEGGQDLGE